MTKVQVSVQQHALVVHVVLLSFLLLGMTVGGTDLEECIGLEDSIAN